MAILASGAGGANGAGEFTFYPQAGILWRDLYPNNFVDLDPGPGVRDYARGTQDSALLGHAERRPPLGADRDDDEPVVQTAYARRA